MDNAKHLIVIKDFLDHVNKYFDNPYVLKGGTALSLCYDLNRFSEDIDFDIIQNKASRKQFFNDVDDFCGSRGYDYRVSKDTETTQRVYVDYGVVGRPLKIEVSYRRIDIPDNILREIDGIQVYCLDELAGMKASAYSGRDKIRDLYDITFLCTHYWDSLSPAAKDSIRRALEYKDMEQFDYLVETQQDSLIDIGVLEQMFLESFDRLGLLRP